MFEMIKKTPKFWISNVVMALFCYGFELTNSSIGIDDENIMRALGGRMIEQGRLGYNIVDTLFNISNYLPFVYLFLAMCLFIIANAIITNFFEQLTDKFSENESIIYSIVVLSYPAFAYKLIFNMCQLQMGLVYFFSVLCTIHCYKIFKETKLLSIKWIYALAEIVFIIANFETGIIYVAILFVFSIILSDDGLLFGELFKQAFKVLVVVATGFVINKVLVELVRSYLGIVADDYVSGYIMYTSDNLIDNFIATVLGFWTRQMTEGVSALFLVVILVGSVLFIKNQSMPIVNKVLLFFAQIILFMSFPVLTGNPAPLERAILYEAFFGATCACLAAMAVKEMKVLKYIFLLVLIVNTYNNAMEVNQVVYQDYVKNNLDKNLAYEIYSEIQEFDYRSKPVVFVGAIEAYDLPLEINLGTESFFRHDIAYNNYLAYETPNFRIYAYFDMLGLNIIEADDVLTVEAKQFCVDAPCFPKAGSVFETEKAIVVKLGENNLFNLIDQTTIQVVDSFVSNEDYYSETEDFIELAGWVYSEEHTPARLKKYLLFTNVETGESFVATCANVERNDVTEAFDIKEEYKWSGYSVKIPKVLIQEGKYNVKVIAGYKGAWYDFKSNIHSVDIEYEK